MGFRKTKQYNSFAPRFGRHRIEDFTDFSSPSKKEMKRINKRFIKNRLFQYRSDSVLQSFKKLYKKDRLRIKRYYNTINGDVMSIYDSKMIEKEGDISHKVIGFIFDDPVKFVNIDSLEKRFKIQTYIDEPLEYFIVYYKDQILCLSPIPITYTEYADIIMDTPVMLDKDGKLLQENIDLLNKWKL